MEANAQLGAAMKGKIIELMDVYKVYNENLQQREVDFASLKLELQKEIDQNAAKDQQLAAITEDLESTKRQLEIKTAELCFTYDVLSEEIAEGKLKLLSAQRQIQKLQREKLEVFKQLNEKQDELDAVRSELDSTNSKLDDLIFLQESNFSADVNLTSESESPPDTPPRRLTLSPIFEEDAEDVSGDE